MISPKVFIDELKKLRVDFFTGVPDSLLKDISAFIMDNTPPEKHIISANEGSAIALASGYHFATGKIGMVYLQNSGLGNIINPLLSLADPAVYSVPMIVLVGWRGEPGVQDEPQHLKQGEVTEDVFNALNIPYEVLNANAENVGVQLGFVVETAMQRQGPVVLLVKKNSFESYKLQKQIQSYFSCAREDVIESIVKGAPKDAIFVSTTGKASRELFEIRSRQNSTHEKDFLTIGSMGHASQIALSIAMEKKDRVVFCLDGDGAFLMHMGGAAIIGSCKPRNLVHVILNNGAHESVGGQPTCALNIQFDKLSESLGYANYFHCTTIPELDKALDELEDAPGPSLLEVKIKVGSRKDLSRPTTTPKENKLLFMDYLRK
ncbi:MAG: phosphonopyruvate decarboxylase [Bdellovibrionota bacterium]